MDEWIESKALLFLPFPLTHISLTCTFIMLCSVFIHLGEAQSNDGLCFFLWVYGWTDYFAREALSKIRSFGRELNSESNTTIFKVNTNHSVYGANFAYVEMMNYLNFKNIKRSREKFLINKVYLLKWKKFSEYNSELKIQFVNPYKMYFSSFFK